MILRIGAKPRLVQTTGRGLSTLADSISGVLREGAGAAPGAVDLDLGDRTQLVEVLDVRAAGLVVRLHACHQPVQPREHEPPVLPLAILRVRDTNATRATEPYPAPAYDLRTASSELALADDLARLIAAVKQRWGQPTAPSRPFMSMASEFDLVGQHCLRRPMNCVGDTQDTDYRATARFRLEAGQVIAVVGTLGTATGNATYTGLAVNRAGVGLGVANISHFQLAGTAAAFSGTVGNTGKFYVYYLARACQGISPCLELPDTLVPPGEPILLMQRNYIRPGSARGADPAQLLSPWTVVFDRAMLPPGR